MDMMNTFLFIVFMVGFFILLISNLMKNNIIARLREEIEKRKIDKVKSFNFNVYRYGKNNKLAKWTREYEDSSTPSKGQK